MDNGSGWIFSDEELREVDEVEYDFVGGAYTLRRHGEPLRYRGEAIIIEHSAGRRFADVLATIQRLQDTKFQLVQKGTREAPYLNDRYARESWRS